jgi:hypothetical protein
MNPPNLNLFQALAARSLAANWPPPKPFNPIVDSNFYLHKEPTDASPNSLLPPAHYRADI